MLHPARRALTRVGELTTHPIAFAMVVVYAVAWLIFSSETFGWGAIATLATWLMTLFINRTEHRDTQAIHAKIDELLRTHGEARTDLTRLDERDVEDIEALSTHTGATYLFGLSSGAVIALTSTLRIGMIRKAIIYEPPFYFKQGIDEERVDQFHREIRNENWLKAMTTAGEIVKLAPLPVRLLPRSLRERLTAGIMQTLGGGGGYASLDELLPAMRYDFQVVGEMSQRIQIFKTLNKEVLLLGGTRSPGYLKLALSELEATLPNVSRRTFPGLDHSAPWNSERGGAPLIVAEAVQSFLKN